MLFIYPIIETAMENPISYQKTLDDLLEFKKLAAKLEDALEKKEMELTDLVRVYQDLKDLYEKTRNECNEINARLQAVYSEKSLMEKRYEEENKKLKAYFDKQKETYESQILKLRNYDSIALKNKLIAEAEMKYTQVIKCKDFEIDSLQDKYNQATKEKDLLSKEYNEYKDQMTLQMNNLTANHKQEIKDLYAKMDSLRNSPKDSAKEQSSLQYYQNEIEVLRKQVLDLTTSVIAMKSEKEIMITDINSQKAILFKEVEGEKFKRELVEKENSQLASTLKGMQTEIATLKQQNSNALEDLNNFKRERDLFIGELNEKQEEFSMFKEEIMKLRGLITSREIETNDLIKESEDKLQSFINHEKNEKTDYQSQIEALSAELLAIKTHYHNSQEKALREKEEMQHEYYLLIEEKKMLIQKQHEIQNEIGVIRAEFEKKARALAYYEEEYLALDQKYRDLSHENSEKEMKIKSFKSNLNEAEKEKGNLNAYLERLKHDKPMTNSDMDKKYKELLRKKQYYKRQCKKCNENIALIIKKLTPNDRKELELHTELLKEISQSEDSAA